VWKVDANGKLSQQTISQFSTNERVTNIICKPSNFADHER
jgi:hypothetical protein